MSVRSLGDGGAGARGDPPERMRAQQELAEALGQRAMQR